MSYGEHEKNALQSMDSYYASAKLTITPRFLHVDLRYRERVFLNIVTLWK